MDSPILLSKYRIFRVDGLTLITQHPHYKNKEVVETWLKAIEKHPRPEDLFTPLIETAVRIAKMD